MKERKRRKNWHKNRRKVSFRKFVKWQWNLCLHSKKSNIFPTLTQEFSKNEKGAKFSRYRSQKFDTTFSTSFFYLSKETSSFITSIGSAWITYEFRYFCRHFRFAWTLGRHYFISLNSTFFEDPTVVTCSFVGSAGQFERFKRSANHKRPFENPTNRNTPLSKTRYQNRR